MSRKKMRKKDNFNAYVPGIIVCVIIALLSKGLAIFLPGLGAATLSILIGIIVGNTIGNKTSFQKGSKFCEGILLSISIVFLGGTLSIGTLLALGWGGILFIILQMSITILGVILIGRYMGFETNFIYLMASGNAVCGSSAVASTAPVIKAHSKEKGIAITMVNVTGTVLMLVLPFIANIAFGNNTVKTSAFIGGILQSVGQVVASASMISEEVRDLATLFKIVRIIFLVGVVFLLATLKERSVEKAAVDIEEEMHSHTHQNTIKVPWYIIGFFVLCVLYSLGIIPNVLSSILKRISNFMEIVALAGIGMRVYFKDLINQGVKVSLYCGGIALVQILSALILIIFLVK